MEQRYQDINAKAIDSWVESGWEWGVPVSKEDCDKARGGDWDVLLTPTRFVPKDWFPELKGAKLLGLASGGGQQMPLFALLGANCTVLDYSDRQLENERLVSEREGYSINIVKSDMTKRLPFKDGSFDIIFHPVSNVFVEDVYHVWRECFRVLTPGGILLSGLDNGINFLFDDEYGEPLTIVNSLPYNPLKDPALYDKTLKSGDKDYQFSHTFDEQIGGQLKAGFIITGAYEDFNGILGDALDARGIPTFWATKAVKPL